MHVASELQGEVKTHKTIMEEYYSNIPTAAVKTYIANCETCAEKNVLEESYGIFYLFFYWTEVIWPGQFLMYIINCIVIIILFLDTEGKTAVMICEA